jgi:glycosyltransferase involved in cell wall biosynthesis
MFSVVIPLYNKEKSIGNTIQSVLNQTFQDFEIVVVNDGSTDDSLQVVENINDSRIRIINKPNGGVSSARNRGVKEAKYEWIAFLDGDDVWDSSYLEEMNQFIEEYSEADVYGCAFDDIVNEKSIKRNFYLPENYKGYISNYFQHALNSLLFWPTSTIISKSAFLDVGGFDERINLGEDIDLWIRLAYHNKVAFYNKVLAHYNFDGPNRAMNKRHDFKRNYLYYTDKFKTWENENNEFRLFINKNRISHLVEILKNYSHENNDVKKYMSLIDYEGQEFRYLLFSKLPYYYKKKIINFLY